MKLLRTIANKIVRSSKKAKMFASVVLVATSVSGAVVLAGYTPADRPTFDYNKYSGNDNCADTTNIARDHGRCGSLNGPVMNSFVNTPSYGDERAFFDATLDQSPTSFHDVLPNVASDGSQSHEVILRTFIHNDANQGLNGDGVNGTSVAHGATVRVALPSGTETALRARSFVNINNPAAGSPAEVTDTTELNDSKAFSISYVPGSAVIYNGAHESGLALSDSIVTTGTPIGYQNMDGNLPGCFDYKAYVEIKVKINVPQNSITKMVRKLDTNNSPSSYAKSINVAPGDKERWVITFQNKGNTPLTNVSIYDQLPPHLKVIPGSVDWQYTDTNGKEQNAIQSDTDLFSRYVTLGTWNPSGGFNIYFDTIALDDFDGCSVDLRNIVHNTTTQTPNDTTDHADVTINKQNCNTTPPVYTCDAFNITPGDNRTVKVSEFKQTADHGAIFKNVVINWGDNTTPLTTDMANVIGQQHQFAADGTYTVIATANFTVNGQPASNTGIQCQQRVTFSPTKPPVVTPPVTPPTQLVNTGAGSTVGIFATVTVAGMLAYRWMLGRRLGRENS